MFDKLTHGQDDAIVLLKDDHDKVKSLFDDFEKAKTNSQKNKIAKDIINELDLHAAAEEELFYPAVRKTVGKEIMNEGDEEHHVAKVLIAEITKMKAGDEYFDSKVKVLGEMIKHHIKEEESLMFPKAREAKIDFNELGKLIIKKKTELKKKGVPKSNEQKMVDLIKNKGDSPAEAARKFKSPLEKLKYSQAS